MKKIILAAIGSLLLFSCASGPDEYTYQEMGQASSVHQGKVIAIRAVQVASQSGIGQTGGAVAGGALGSMVGGNTATHIVGAVGGAILGGFFGNQTEKVITKETAYEFTVLQSDGKVIAVIQKNPENIQLGDEVLLVGSMKNMRIQKINY
jgi:outer membrane lipoprotein SlyB